MENTKKIINNQSFHYNRLYKEFKIGYINFLSEIDFYIDNSKVEKNIID